MTTLKAGKLDSALEGIQTVSYGVTLIPLPSLQCCRDFQTRKLACNAIILRKLHRTRKVFFRTILHPCKINLRMQMCSHYL